MSLREWTTSLPNGYALHIFEELDGTNAEALRRGCPHGLIVLADRQTAGRGRQQREWQSLAGNLFLTVCIEPPDVRIAGQLAFVAALAVLDAASECAPTAPFSLKWPNDLLSGGRKLAGILIEACDTGGYAVGIGVNIAHAPSDSEVRFPATCLQALTQAEVTTARLAESLCRHFDRWYREWQADGFEPLRAGWLASAHGIGDTIAVSTGSGPIEGRFGGIGEDGSLILLGEGGDRRTIAAGDVFFPARTG